jgi:antitoxin component YwqK of YwqJK toxin-antitoxin module
MSLFGKKKRREDFQPTGNIVYFDEKGNPTHWYSIKEGKFWGRQIQWNKEGKIIHDENIAEAKDNCDSLWIEFGRSKF